MIGKRLQAILLLFLVAASTLAQRTWDGDAGTSLPQWSMADNWVGNSAPAKGGGGVITFHHLGIGRTNVVDDDWVISSLLFTNEVPGAAHTTVVAEARTLKIVGNNGALSVGDARSNSWAEIRGGTVEIGSVTSRTDIRVGPTSGHYPNNRLVMRTDLNAVNLLNLHVGRSTSGTSANRPDATLDLSGSSIRCGEEANTLRALNLVVGGGGGRNPNGTLLLPESLEVVELGSFEAAYGISTDKGQAFIDFGAGARLRLFSASNYFALGRNGTAIMTGWPTGVVLQVGLPGKPAPMYVGCIAGAIKGGAVLAVPDGVFTGHLSQLWVGSSISGGTTASTTGILDLATAMVQIGDTPNQVKVPDLRVGGLGGRNPTGILRLPASVTAIEAGILDVGTGLSAHSGYGVIDLGMGSQLERLAVTNAFIFGGNGSAYFLNWPANVAVEVGTPEAPVSNMTVGCSSGGDRVEGRLILSGGSFRAQLSTLRVGTSGDGSGSSPTGVLDLASAEVQIGDTTNQVKLDTLQVGIMGRSPNGTLRLPPAITAIRVGRFGLGGGFGSNAGRGTIDFGPGSALASFTVTNEFVMGDNGEAVMLNWPAGVAVKIGSESARASMELAIANSDRAWASLALTGGSLEGWLSRLRVAVNDNDSSSSDPRGTLDLRTAELRALDVEGNLQIAHSPAVQSRESRGVVRLPAGEARIGGDIQVGDTGVNNYGLLELNGTRLRAQGSVQIFPSGRLTNFVDGVSGGLDMEFTEASWFSVSNNGRCAVVFRADPVNPGAPYWGLRMRGDARSHLEGLMQVPVRLVLDGSGLSAANQAKLGVHYDPRTDTTLVGLMPDRERGTLIQLR